MSEPETITITVKAAAGWGNIPLTARLKRWLKSGLRGHGIRCVSVAPATCTAPPGAALPADDAGNKAIPA